MRCWALHLALIALALSAAAGPAHAQLLSPGPLTRSHADLEGLRSCTSCHQLGRRGVDPDRCLSCHEPLRDRIRSNRGLHAQLERDCGSCHSDHNGRAFDIVRFDERRFDHTKAGFRLVGEHASASCRSCHTRNLITDPAVRRQKAPAGRLDDTFLGLATDCATCHRPENPHKPPIRTQACTSCHTAEGWDRVPSFNHRDTGFQLTGAHVRIACTSCHGAPGTGAARFRQVPTTCASCHGDENPHGRQFEAQSCASCHTTSVWAGAEAFNHERTAFPLAGAHVQIACSSCHGSGRSARYDGVSSRCLSCHAEDSPHQDQFPGRECSTCHGASTWTSAPAFSHARAEFPLVGLHIQVACESCHPTTDGTQQFVGIEAETCQSCHEDTHDGTLGADCASCHSPNGWNRIDGSEALLAERFDHEQHTGFALVGAHAEASCASCHGTGRGPAGFARRDADFEIRLAGASDGATFPGIEATSSSGACLSCHTDAHRGVLADLPGGADCASCHEQTAWMPSGFDRTRHTEETPFALTGAHVVVPCGACHTGIGEGPPTFEVSSTCASCHAEESPHGDQFANAEGLTVCADCHATASWDAADFDHAARTDFALTGAHALTACVDCHARPDAPEAVWTFAGLDATCQTCHADDNPHAGQFEGRTCSSCHDTDAFTLDAFDHDQTAFPLVGGHVALTCASCHQPETGPDGTRFIRFSPLPTECAGCHTDR